MADAAQGNPPPFNFKAAITQMVQRNGSDLLLKVGRPATIRVNGDLVALETQPLKPEELKSLAEQIMTPRQVKELGSTSLNDQRNAEPSSSVPRRTIRSPSSPPCTVWIAPNFGLTNTTRHSLALSSKKRMEVPMFRSFSPFLG